MQILGKGGGKEYNEGRASLYKPMFEKKNIIKSVSFPLKFAANPTELSLKDVFFKCFFPFLGFQILYFCFFWFCTRLFIYFASTDWAGTMHIQPWENTIFMIFVITR